MPTESPRPPSDPQVPRRVVVAGIATGTVPPGDEESTGAALLRRARALRDAGAEVVWAGTDLTPEQVAAIAVAEDADGVEVAPPVAVDGVVRALQHREAADVEVTAVEG